MAKMTLEELRKLKFKKSDLRKRDVAGKDFQILLEWELVE